MVRGLAATTVYLALLGCTLFASAGRIDWPLAWACLGMYAAISVVSVFLADPGLVRERSRVRRGTKALDMVLATVSFLLFFPSALLVAGLDVGRFGWSPSLPPALQIVAVAVFALGNAFGLWAVVRNRYFSTFVRIQEDRGHVVVRDGPYRFVRHPGYAGSIVASLALPLALGSLWALLPAFIGACGFVVRTWLEDGTLMRELTGYRDYARDTRHRLIPGVW